MKLTGECKQAESIRKTYSRDPSRYNLDFYDLDEFDFFKRNSNETKIK